MRKSILLALCSLLLLTGCVAELQRALLGKNVSVSGPVLVGMEQAIAYPLYFGFYSSPNTMIFFHNPQCPASSRAWNIVRDFAERQAPSDFKLVVVGGGFNLPGTWLLHYGTVVAEQNQSLAREYLSAVSREIKSMPANTGDWTRRWQKKQPASVFNAQRANNLVAGDMLDLFADVGTQNVEKKYNIRATPTFIINGRVYKGTASVEGFTDFMRKHAPYAALP
ncbi:DsbA family protein [Desulfovibrio sp. OttesenSCG-928-A18]|nr:DsbA family protein [Desulfovibrio sp. OttesenSCG-928-A18]